MARETTIKTTLRTIMTTRLLVLKDTDAEWCDWGGYPIQAIHPGETVKVLIQEFSDGRVYYTAFKLVHEPPGEETDGEGDGEDRLYTTTSLRQRGEDGRLGPVEDNVGDGPISRNAVCQALGIDYHAGPGRRPVKRRSLWQRA